MMLIEILTVERKQLYEQRSSTQEEQEKSMRQDRLQRWQKKWDASDKGRWTHRLIPRVDGWVNRKHGEVNYYLTQMLSNHGFCRDYLHWFKENHSAQRGAEYPKMRNTYSSGANASLTRERNWKTHWDQHLRHKPS